MEVILTQPFVCCPGCGNPSDHVHCQCQRTVHDVPCGGRRVVLRLSVRKFFCRVPTCLRKVFAERLLDLVQPWARVSKRLLEELKAIGLSASAKVSERLAPRLSPGEPFGCSPTIPFRNREASKIRKTSYARR
ncbi:MAG: transposase family protein [Ktedonobacteraceae bacterium]|nr:transposase family protein [Ktedonobacteraceae bacterium]